ncbi:replication protein, partial [Alteribacillus iranensis]
MDADVSTLNNSNLEKARYHAWFHHKDADGYITLAKKTTNGFKQYHYKPEQLAHELSQWIGEDVYFSQNTFYKPQRRIEHVRQLRALYVDIDCYLLNYAPDWTLGKLELEMFDTALPEPNLIIFSGRGLVLIWLIDPVPYQALPLWQAIQNHFVQQLETIGGDAKASDAARVFRLDGSVNSKNRAEVHVHYRHDYRYVLRDIQDEYLPDLKPKKQTKGRPNRVRHLFNTYTLYHARLLDLVKLVELRQYEVDGYREVICFLYRYWQCCYLSDPEEALNQSLLLNQEFTNPLPDGEVIRATKSAEKAWEAKNSTEANRIAQEKGYLGAGYNISNKKLINWLDITSVEQQELKTIIDGNEKRRRKRIANMENRRKKGMRTREEYIKAQHDKTDNQLIAIQKLLKKGYKQKQIAERLGVSRGRVSQLV